MAASTLESGLTTKNQVRALTNGAMVGPIRETGLKTACTEKGSFLGLTDAATRAITNWIRGRALEYINGRTEATTKGTG
jgi:hypothetical protein